MAPASRRNRWRWCCSAACAATNACTATASAWRSCRTWCAATAASSTCRARANSAAPASKSGSLPACRSGASAATVGAAMAASPSPVAAQAPLLQGRRSVQLFEVRRDLRHRAAQQLRVAEVVLAAHREELLGGLGGVGIEQGAAAAVHLAHEGVVGLLEVARPFALPGARQRRGAVEHAVERIELVRHLVHRHAEAGAGLGDV